MAKNDFDCTTLTPEQRDARLALDVERLLRFGRKHKLIKELDELVARNTLLDLRSGSCRQSGHAGRKCLAGEQELDAQRRAFCQNILKPQLIDGRLRN